MARRHENESEDSYTEEEDDEEGEIVTEGKVFLFCAQTNSSVHRLI